MGVSDPVRVSPAGSALDSVAALRAAAARGSAALSDASFGNGTSAHLAGAMLAMDLGAALIHAPFKGQAPALAALLGAQVSLMFGSWPELRARVATGRRVALGMATARRTRQAPRIPTLIEQGLAIESNTWSGLMTRAGTPEPTVEPLASVLGATLSAPAVRSFETNGITALQTTPSQCAAFLQREVDKYARVILDAGITAEG